MAIVKTAQDLGTTIRARRKRLGWDQARLAREIGASRQWIVDIEKGKDRAELGLILRAINALGLSLYVDQASANTTPSPNDTSRTPQASSPDVNRIVDRHRALSGATQAAKDLQSSLPDFRELMRGQGAAAQAAKELQSSLPNLQELMREQNAAAQVLKSLQSSLPDIQELVREQSAAAQIAKYLQSSVPDDLRALMREQNAAAEPSVDTLTRVSTPSREVAQSAAAPNGRKRRTGKRPSKENPH